MTKIKTYLNAEERSRIVILDATVNEIKDTLINWQHNLTGTERKYLKMSLSFALKAVDLIMERLDACEQKKIKRQLDTTKCICLPVEQAIDRVKKFIADTGAEPVLVRADYFDDILENCLYACNPCRWDTEEEKAMCKARAAMFACDIPVYDSQTSGCPYEQVR